MANIIHKIKKKLKWNKGGSRSRKKRKAAKRRKPANASNHSNKSSHRRSHSNSRSHSRNQHIPLTDATPSSRCSATPSHVLRTPSSNRNRRRKSSGSLFGCLSHTPKDHAYPYNHNQEMTPSLPNTDKRDASPSSRSICIGKYEKYDTLFDEAISEGHAHSEVLKPPRRSARNDRTSTEGDIDGEHNPHQNDTDNFYASSMGSRSRSRSVSVDRSQIEFVGDGVDAALLSPLGPGQCTPRGVDHYAMTPTPATPHTALRANMECVTPRWTDADDTLNLDIYEGVAEVGSLHSLTLGFPDSDDDDLRLAMDTHVDEPGDFDGNASESVSGTETEPDAEARRRTLSEVDDDESEEDDRTETETEKHRGSVIMPTSPTAERYGERGVGDDTERRDSMEKNAQIAHAVPECSEWTDRCSAASSVVSVPIDRVELEADQSSLDQFSSQFSSLGVDVGVEFGVGVGGETGREDSDIRRVLHNHHRPMLFTPTPNTTTANRSCPTLPVVTVTAEHTSRSRALSDLDLSSTSRVHAQSVHMDTATKTKTKASTSARTPSKSKSKMVCERGKELEYHDRAAFTAQFVVGTKINEGGFGSVWRVRSKALSAGASVSQCSRQCVKIMELGHDEKSFARRTKGCLREFSMTHRAFADEAAEVALFMDDASVKKPKAYLVMPYFKGKDLFEFIDDADYQRTVSDALILHIFYKMMEKLYDLHYFKNIVHGDLKPENVMILQNQKQKGNALEGLEVEIIDYGIAKSLRHLSSDRKYLRSKGHFGTKGYVAPELMNGSRYNRKIDVFSAGVVLYNMVTECCLFPKGHKYYRLSQADYYKYLKRKLKCIRRKKGIVDLLYSCLAFDPDERLDVKQLIDRFYHDRR